MSDYTIPTSNTMTTIDPHATKIRELQSDVTELENRLRALWDKLEGERKHYMEQIRRLEEAGNELMYDNDDMANINRWHKAKEAKP